LGEWIYYGKLDDNAKIYKVKTDGSGKEKINDDMSLFISIAGNWIYYDNLDDHKAYRIKTDGSERQPAD